ncbi:SbcC/MukB-like Walker B domain-containing protein [Streptomonospora wellingtoniae]|uniref:SbcC/MukB-like Walker B domain-containing protein n=1 Tax=Streptomonospora wellingtoniae TaxID=3075544 RepID=A0ABU2KMQ9_9ACTN|nr:SbcC/MukB-like Walker B domain-containing protein [Streptomonospora sp. DSM 45055]MDT0300493.1 SbcC/MukB-like Walker B domain-containing protein [Streptomonospora sp. DSM 45055]
MTVANAHGRTEPSPPGGGDERPGGAIGAQESPPVDGSGSGDAARLPGEQGRAAGSVPAGDLLGAAAPTPAAGTPAATRAEGGGAAEPATGPSERGGDAVSGRYRLNRAGIQNVWHYDDHVFDFADGRLLLRGRNGAGKSKALEMLLPFLLDGDARRLDTTGSSRTNLRWLLLEGRDGETSRRRGADPSDPAAGAGDPAEPAEQDGPTATLGYLWVEFTRSGGAAPAEAGGRADADAPGPRRITLGAAVTASPGTDARSVFFITEREAGTDLPLVSDGRPMPIDRLRTEVGPGNCYDTPVDYRARVMRELFGIDDPVRYRNLIHLLYRLRRPTIGERLEAGELVSVLAEALPPMDETVLDEMARNITDLEQARTRLEALRTAREQVAGFLGDYRGYLHRALRIQSGAVREQVEAYRRRDSEVERLTGELEELVTAEGTVQEERDRLRRTRDTAASDAATLSRSGDAPEHASDFEQQARDAAVSAYIRAAEAASAAAGYANTNEEQAKHRVGADIAAIGRALDALGGLHERLRTTAQTAGVDPRCLGQVPDPVPTTLAPRESVTRVNLEGLEQAVEREPVTGVDADDLRSRLAELHDRLSAADQSAAEREAAVADLAERAERRTAAEQREAALAGEAEAAEAALERAREREQTDIDAVRAASADYADRVRGWCAGLRETAPDADLGAQLAELESLVELPLEDSLRVLDADVPERVARHAHGIVDPLLRELRTRRDTAVGEERELSTELDELSERRSAASGHIAPDRPAWATAGRDDAAGAPFYLAVDFASDLSHEDRAGLEAALEASGVLSGWIAADGSLTDGTSRDLLLAPGRPVKGRSLRDVLVPVDPVPGGVTSGAVSALLDSVGLLPPPGEEEPEPRHRRDSPPPAASAVSLDGRWRLGAASGAHSKSGAEYIGKQARAETGDRTLANIDRRIAIAEALLAEAGERRGDIERMHAALVETDRALPDPSGVLAAWSALDNARAWLAGTQRAHNASCDELAQARETTLSRRAELADPADRRGLSTGPAELAATRTALERLRTELAAAHSDLDELAVLLEDYRGHSAAWEDARSGRILAEDARTAAITDMITVRREIELTDRARAAAPDQISGAVGQVRERMDDAADRLPGVEREAQRARDDRVGAETRLDTAVLERAEQARRALDSGRVLRSMLARDDGGPDPALLAAAGLEAVAGHLAPEAAVADAVSEPSERPEAEAEPQPDRAAQAEEEHGKEGEPQAAGDPAEAAAEADHDALAARVAALDALLASLKENLDPEPAADGELDDSGILRRREELHGMLAASEAVGAWTELTEPAGLKRLTVHCDDGSHDITGYAGHLDEAVAAAEEDALLREEEAFERHLLGELAGHLRRQIEEARALISTMNDVLGDTTTSQGLGVRLDWQLAPDADEDIQAVVPLLARPPEQRTRVETTRLRDALRRCIEAIRRLDPTATGGAQLRAALDYRSWFAFTVYVTDAAHPGRERRLSHRTALSQGEQRVVAYLVLFAAAAAQFGSLAAQAPVAPRLILLDDAFAKVDEPTHGRLLGLLVELDLDFVLTSERVWGCFESVPSLHIYECLRDPAVPGIATLHFTWDGSRRRLVGV